MDGLDKVETAIQLIKDYEMLFSNQAKEQGFFVAFSGGKDSCVVKKLCDMADVKYDAHYSVTTVDPPELVRFIKAEYPDVIFEKHYYDKDGYKVKKGEQITMKNLIPERLMPPTRMVRYCCQMLKETAGDGRLTITGVRRAESVARAQSQGIVTIYDIPKKDKEKFVESGNFRQTNRGGWYL